MNQFARVCIGFTNGKEIVINAKFDPFIDHFEKAMHGSKPIGHRAFSRYEGMLIRLDEIAYIIREEFISERKP